MTEDKNKDDRIAVAVSPDEKEELIKAAHAAGITKVSTWLRSVGLVAARGAKGA